MLQRSKIGIKHGLVLMHRTPKFNYMITLGTGFSKFEALGFLKKYLPSIQSLKFDLIKIVNKDAKMFLPEIYFNS
jgi:hypothetical protein